MGARHICRGIGAIALSAGLMTGCAKPDARLTNIEFLLDWKPQMEQAGFIVADAKGYYRQAGLSVTMHDGQGATTTAMLVGSGQYPLGIASGGATIIARSRGVPVVSIALINQRSPTVIFSLASSGIRTPSDLIGKKIGLTKTGVKYDEYRALMNKLSIDRSMITEVDLKKSVAPLLSGTVDAMLGYTEDQPVLVELQGLDVVRISMYRYGINLLSTNIVTNETYMAEHPDICRKFVEASLKGWKRAVENPEEAVLLYMERYPASDGRFVRENFRQFVPILFGDAVDSLGIGAQTLSGFRDTERLLFDLGIIERRVGPATAFTNAFLPVPGVMVRPPESARPGPNAR